MSPRSGLTIFSGEIGFFLLRAPVPANTINNNPTPMPPKTKSLRRPFMSGILGKTLKSCKKIMGRENGTLIFADNR
jgi:hypothetical protein